MAVYITGDTHRDFQRIFDFCNKNNTNQQDYYDDQNQYNKSNSDIIDVEYTQKDISDEK